MVYKIEKNVPAPLPLVDDSEYPLTQMNVGDSFVAPADHKSSIRCLMHKMHKTTKLRFTSRIKENKIRVWRIK